MFGRAYVRWLRARAAVDHPDADVGRRKRRPARLADRPATALDGRPSGRPFCYLAKDLDLGAVLGQHLDLLCRRVLSIGVVTGRQSRFEDLT